MSVCIRNGVTYKRHNRIMGPECIYCGVTAPRVEALDESKFLDPGVSVPVVPSPSVDVQTWEGEGGQ